LTLQAVDPDDTPELPSPSDGVTKFQRSIDVKPVPISRSAADLQIADAPPPTNYELPPVQLLDDAEPFPQQEHDAHLRERAALLEKSFTDFGMGIRVVNINTGPVITQYEIALETGLRVGKVTALSDDLALS